jgi:hypothetical protein
MKLKQILREHDRYRSTLALSGAFGDAYLIHHNPVYHAVRKAARGFGYRFQSTPLGDYDVMALTQLPLILKSKRIPYRKNVKAIRDIEKALPNTFHLHDIPPFAASYAFHESAHGVAQELCKQVGLSRPKSDPERALLILFQESFANACESIANVYSRSRFHDEFLFKNAYVMEKSKNRETLRAAIRAFGFEATFKVLLLSFLQANLDQTDRADERLTLYLDWLGIKPSRTQRPILTSVFRIGFDLDPQFVLFTNSFCLKLMGIQTPFAHLQDFDTAAALKGDARWLKALDLLSEALSSR